MARTRHLIAAALTGVALAAAGCGGDEEDSPARTDDAPVNTETPQANPGTTPAPDSDPETRTTRTDG